MGLLWVRWPQGSFFTSAWLRYEMALVCFVSILSVGLARTRRSAVVPVLTAAGVGTGYLVLLAVLEVLWPDRMMGCHVHTYETGGYDDWLCFGPLPIVTEGRPALYAAALASTRAVVLSSFVTAAIAGIPVLLGRYVSVWSVGLSWRSRAVHAASAAGIVAALALAGFSQTLLNRAECLDRHGMVSYHHWWCVMEHDEQLMSEPVLILSGLVAAASVLLAAAWGLRHALLRRRHAG